MGFVGFTNRGDEIEMFNKHMLEELARDGWWETSRRADWFAAKWKVIRARFPQARYVRSRKLRTSACPVTIVYLPEARQRVLAALVVTAGKAAVIARDAEKAVKIVHAVAQSFDKRSCKHPTKCRVIDSRRLPLRHGSAEVQTCLMCGCWRDTRNGTGSKVEWRTDDLDQLIRQAEVDDED